MVNIQTKSYGSLKKKVAVKKVVNKPVSNGSKAKQTKVTVNGTGRRMKGVAQLLKARGNGHLVLDGAFSTQMEQADKTIDLLTTSKLWGGDFVHTHPNTCTDVHQKYYESGADVVISNSYKMSVDLIMSQTEGLKFKSVKKAEDLIKKSIKLVTDARSMAQAEGNCQSGALVAASMGPYCIGKGSEFEGAFVSTKKLMEWHRRRFEIFVDNTKADILAIESIPTLQEVKALLKLIATKPNCRAWITVCCGRINEGELNNKFNETVEDFAKLVEKMDKKGQVEALGLNCCAPNIISDSLTKMRKHTKRPLIIYPNSGEKYIYKSEGKLVRSWVTTSNQDLHGPEQFAKMAKQWKKIGAPIIIGGCCRTGPEHIQKIKNALELA